MKTARVYEFFVALDYTHYHRDFLTALFPFIICNNKALLPMGPIKSKASTLLGPNFANIVSLIISCLLYTSPSPRD